MALSKVKTDHGHHPTGKAERWAGREEVKTAARKRRRREDMLVRDLTEYDDEGSIQ